MKNYALNGALVGGASYVDYLKLQAAEHNHEALEGIRYDVRSQFTELIATEKQLSDELGAHINKAADQITTTLENGFVGIYCKLTDIEGQLTEIKSTLHWGFSEVIAQLGGVNAKLEDLLKISKSPAQTWAYNQFEIARDAIRQKLYPEALEHVTRAIDGLGDNPGYALDHRFHFIKGLVCLGSFKNFDPLVVDQSEAESSFLKAARYARHDNPKDSARAFVCAGWASYCQGNMVDAEEHTLAALELNPSFGEANYQIAKIRAHQGFFDSGASFLKRAIYLDKGYAFKSCADA